jgi:hypothetical protein
MFLIALRSGRHQRKTGTRKNVKSKPTDAAAQAQDRKSRKMTRIISDIEM